VSAPVRDGCVLPPGKPWSLWDIMFNYGVFGLCTLLERLAVIEWQVTHRVNVTDSAKSLGYAEQLQKYFVTNGDKFEEVSRLELSEIDGLLRYATQQADKLELQPVHDRVELFRARLRHQISLHDFLAEVRTLRETIEAGIRFKRFYLYPEKKAEAVLLFAQEWIAVIRKFPQSKDEAEAAVDCWALGHSTAAVFHSMRVLEYGLRELAAAVNLTFDVQQWHTIIDQIEAAIGDLGNKWPNTTTKKEWLSFYSAAAKEFRYFKDGWRNYVSHGGDPYDEHQAKSVLEHVRAFMTHLSSRLAP
jgi:hypothetical protein